MAELLLIASVALLVGGVAAVVLRLRERKHRLLREEAVATRARLQASLAPGGVSVLAVARDGFITWFEGGNLPGTVVGRTALLGRSAWEAMHAWPGLVATLRGALSGARGVSRLSIGKHALDVSYAPRFDDKGAIIEAVAVIRDVTVEHEEALRAERLADVRSRILGVMSYRLRGQLNGIVGATQLAARVDAVDARRWLASADDASHRMLSYIEHLVDFLELDAGRLGANPRPFSLRAVIDELAAAHATQAAADGTTLVLRYPRTLPDEFDGDGDRIRQAVDLLLTVALGTNHGGQVIVNVDVTTADAGASRVAISVEDNGRGLSAEARTRVFDAFDSTSAMWATRSGSSGLELPLAQRLASMLGGSLEIESEPGAGTTLCFSTLLPRAWGHSEAPDELDGEVRAAGTLLLVDDDAPQRSATRALAEHLGWTVMEAAHGGEALKLLDGGHRFDCVVTELHMPVCDGFALLATIRARGGAIANLPVALLTADSRPTAREAATRRGATAYAVKPIRLDGLASLLRTLQRASSGGRAAGNTAALDGVSLERLSVVDPVEGHEVVRELCAAFVAAAPVEMIRLSDAMRDGDAAGIEEVGASLRRSARLLGAPALGAALDAFLETGDNTERRRAYARLAAETQAVRTALLDLVADDEPVTGLAVAA